ncbi:sugar ABC transporter ATP-binding protein [Herbiconiux moechotypicola]|uniref:Sugar ABC transporter ATP-binding protein n=1 Tax=Herbiconiux moechotypicola TaxID=637393 RepID=A0ABN3DS19_9MICO|nr:sugar ABC transporter ATP-binding protein [Herbiconiux moechotypicola]MCS5730669.1 sugar ABC transporter ATP-binding protein [Herbiconiux moechotypicola]
MSFGPTRALTDIDAVVHPGEIVGLLGHNGAGKSTLLNLVSGIAHATDGSLRFGGEEIGRALTPAAALAAGITVIHQDPALIPGLTVLDNLVLGLPRSGSRRELRARAEAAVTRVGLDAPLDLAVAALAIGERQMLELARGLMSSHTRLLLLDEPTAALGHAETQALHELVQELAAEGAAVVYVSHRLPDVVEICTRVMVLRGGGLVLDRPLEGLTAEAIAHALAPDDDELEFETPEPGAEVLDAGAFSVRGGEVVGLYGMAAGEQFTLLDSITAGGRLGPTIRLDGADLRLDGPADAIAHGVYAVPADRERDGLVAGMAAQDNVLIPWLPRFGTRGWWTTASTGGDSYAAARREFAVHGPPGSSPLSAFSGGNRQKHLLARWLSVESPSVLLLQQPTQGVDISAKRDITRVVRQMAACGCAVVVASAEGDEIAQLCDRALVLHDGQSIPVARSPRFGAELLSTLLALADRHTPGSGRPTPAPHTESEAIRP